MFTISRFQLEANSPPAKAVGYTPPSLSASEASPFPFRNSPFITFAAPPSCLSIPAQRTTLNSVKRLYTIGRIKGGMKFTCSHCAHHVTTLDFDARNGNLRTQAATAINQHATKVHHEPVMFSSLDAQQHTWRA